jgi:nuclear RNA export factor
MNDMNEASGSHNSGGFFRGKGRRKGSPIPRNFKGQGPARKLMVSPSGWYQVTIPYGHKYEKDFILKSLLSATSPDIFIPQYYKSEEQHNQVVFFLEDHNMAEKIMRADRSLPMPDGFKMQIRVRPSIPQVQVDPTMKERMKLVMAKRYNAATKALDLTKFHADPDFSDIFVGLFRPTIMQAAIDIISENIPELEALNLNDNKIYHCDHFRVLNTKLPHIKILYLGNNKLNKMIQLEVFKELPIVELMLGGNPLKDRFKDESELIRYFSFSFDFG